MRILIFCLVIMNSSFAFNWNKCKSGFGKSSNWLGLSTNLSLSSSSYVSSTGDCAAIGSLFEHEKRLFIANNSQYLRHDIAKGSGEYLDAYIELNDCSTKGKDILISKIRNKAILTTDEVLYLSINKTIRSNKILSKECHISG